MRQASIALVVALVGCVSIRPPQNASPAPVYAFEAHPLIAEEWYRTLHVEIERCSGRTRDFNAILFLRVEPGRIGLYGETRDSNVGGAWSRPARVYLDARLIWDEPTIRHELGHYIWQKGDELHDDPLFQICTKL